MRCTSRLWSPSRLEKSLALDVDLRDDPVMKQDEFRLLAGPADADVTTKYAIG